MNEQIITDEQIYGMDAVETQADPTQDIASLPSDFCPFGSRPCWYWAFGECQAGQCIKQQSTEAA